MEGLDEALREFLVESDENLDQLDRDLVAAEGGSPDREMMDRTFRTVHTIKGTCGFLALPLLEKVSHAGENLLSGLRDGRLPWTPEAAAVLLRLTTVLKAILQSVASGAGEGEDIYQDLLEDLERVANGEPPRSREAREAEHVPEDPSPFPPAAEPLTATAAAEPSRDEPASDEPPASTHEPPEVEAAAPPVECEAPATAHAAMPEAPAIPSVVEPPAHDHHGHDHRFHHEHEHGAHSHLAAAPHESASPAEGGRTAELKGNHVRVDVGLLDKLMNLVGELVLARNQIVQSSAARGDAALLGASQRLNLITSELQEGVMKARMQPIGNIWGKLPRVVRDLAASCGKSVRLEMIGQETELDRTIIESIKDPLTHLIRNSVDHGIEAPADRVARGKPETGLLRLRASHENGQVVVEVIDDGRGIDPARIAAKAVERGLITPEQVARTADRDLVRLIFLPGFSTAERVTNVSGRGVGMDVVKTNIEAIGGSIEVQGIPGQGTTLRLRIPLTLAIIPALIVETGGDRYAIPQANLLELVRLDGDSAGAGVETIRETPVYRLRGRLLPLLYLSRVLGVETTRSGTGSGAVNIVVLQTEGRRFGLVVEAVHDSQEIVVKPLGRLLKGLSYYAGAAIMGDGRVSLILDAAGLVREVDLREAAQSSVDGVSGTRSSSYRSFLICRRGPSGRVAVPLDQVSRLEKIPASAVEVADGREVVQYRGEILPLVRIGGDHGGYGVDGDSGAVLNVVVHAGLNSSGAVGFVVDEILDIVEDAAEVKRATQGAGLVGSSVIRQRVTDLVDFRGLLLAVDPSLVVGS